MSSTFWYNRDTWVSTLSSHDISYTIQTGHILRDKSTWRAFYETTHIATSKERTNACCHLTLSTFFFMGDNLELELDKEPHG
jgi:hypothetical protein